MNNIKIYHKDYCPYCKSAKKLMDSLGWQYSEIEVTNDERLFREMVTLSGRKTVPQIFISGEHIGGFDDFKVYLQHLGKLVSVKVV